MAETRTLDIRRYRARDAGAVKALHLRALREAGAYAEELSGYLDRDLDNVEGSYLQNGGEFLVGALDGRVVSMGALRRVSGGEAELKRMRVEPELQRRGFGRRMLERLEERAEDLGFSTLALDTTVGQLGAQRLYESGGFTEVRRGRIGPFECIFYRKSLR